MKFNKTITYFVLLALAMALSSCNSYYDDYDDDNTDNLTIKTIIGNVGVNSWAYSNENNNNYFIATIPTPEITKDVLRNGIVKIYRVFNFGMEKETHTELPYMFQQEEISNDGQAYFFTTEIMAEITAGQVAIIYTESDFYYERDDNFVPEDMVFRIVVMC